MSELTLTATTENIAAVTAFVDEELEKLDCSMKAQMQIDVAIDELFSNIAFYAYENGGDATVRFDYADGVVTLTFIDSGKPYDPTKKDDPDTTLSAEERQIGGLGIFLVKKTMDSLDYRYEDGKNVLTIKKTI
ncbi:MAG: ATP-binding protein [Oscillospiraceae bacterium]|nr:ATP-binding protein [Oscillospiraceae bacterium]MBR0063740.1 ATP-binding protein [Oscillospiraceae bacterium]